MHVAIYENYNNLIQLYIDNNIALEMNIDQYLDEALIYSSYSPITIILASSYIDSYLYMEEFISFVHAVSLHVNNLYINIDVKVINKIHINIIEIK